MPVKKIINNGVFIANLAPLIDGPEAAMLAKTAQAHAAIIDGLHIDVDTDDFKGCEQAQLLVKWIGDGRPDTALMKEWTVEIRSAIDDLAHGKVSEE